MKLDFCCACGEQDTDKLEFHHFVPRVYGGGDEDQNLLTLCHVCHGKQHGYERMNARVLSRAGRKAMTPARHAELSQRRAARRKKRDRDGKVYFEKVVIPALKIEFTMAVQSAEKAAGALNLARIEQPLGGEWTAQIFRKWAHASGVSTFSDPFKEWAQTNIDLVDLAGDRKIGYRQLAARLAASGRVPPLKDWRWTRRTAERFMRCVGQTLLGQTPKEKIIAPLPFVFDGNGSAFTKREYSQVWRSFCRWRGTDGIPVTDMEWQAYLRDHLGGLSHSRAVHIISGLSTVHHVLGGDKLSLRPITREFKKNHRAP